MPWHPPCALLRLILPTYSFFLRLPLSRLMEGASHCVYLGYIVAVSLPLHNLDWILTFSSFRFIFPVQFSRCMLGLISTSWIFGFAFEGSSFLPILQNDTVFQSRFQSDPCPFGLNRILCRSVVSVPLFLTSALLKLDLGYDSLSANHFSLERR